MKTEKEEEDLCEDQYDYCPICGENWSENPKAHKCDRMLLVDRKKPRFDIRDINNYNPEFLKEIIQWQDLKLRATKNIKNIPANEVGLKYW